MKTKVVALLMALTMVCSMAACGAKEEAPAEAPAEESTEAEAPAEEPAEDVVLTYQTPNASDMITTVFAEYQKDHPNVTLDVQVVDNTQLETKIMSQIETGTLPDFGWMNGNVWRNGLAETDSVLDLTDIVASEFGADVFHPEAFKSTTTPDGKIAAFPAEMQIQGYLINPALFEKFNLEIPETFDQMLECAKVFKENGIAMIGSGTMDSWPTWMWYHWIRLWGGQENSEALFKDHSVAWQDTDVVQTYYKLAELREAGAFPENNSTITYEQSKIMFVAEQCAILPTSTDQLAGVVNSELDAAGNVEYWFGPAFTDSPYNQEIAVKMVNNGFGISSKIEENKLAALIDFFKYFYSEAGQNILIKQGLTLPIMADIDESGVSHLTATIVELTKDTTKSSVTGASWCWFDQTGGDVQYFLDFHMAHDGLLNGLVDGSVTAAELPEKLEAMDAQITSGLEAYERAMAE